MEFWELSVLYCEHRMDPTEYPAVDVLDDIIDTNGITVEDWISFSMSMLSHGVLNGEMADFELILISQLEVSPLTGVTISGRSS